MIDETDEILKKFVRHLQENMNMPSKNGFKVLQPKNLTGIRKSSFFISNI